MPHLSVRLRALFLRRKPARNAERDLSLQISTSWTVLLPESFRGGCSFGAGECRSLPSSLILLKLTSCPRTISPSLATIQDALCFRAHVEELWLLAVADVWQTRAFAYLEQPARGDQQW